MPRQNPEGIQMFSRQWGDYPGGTQTTQWQRYREYSGNKTPNFQTYASQHRRLPMLAYSVYYHNLPNVHIDAWFKYPATNAEVRKRGWFWYQLYPYGLSYYDTDAETKAKAQGRLAEAVLDMKVNLAQAMGERKQTANLVAATATRIANAARFLRKGRLDDAARSLGVRPKVGMKQAVARDHAKGRDTLANFWLEMQYGWLPLLQDVFGAAELLATHVVEDRYHTVISAKARTVMMRPTLYMNDGMWPYTNYPAGESMCVHKGRFQINYRLDSAARSALATTGISNPALLAWELLPYSFVIDWFLPVGNYLEQIDAFSGFELVDGIYSSHKRVDFTFDRREEHYDFLGKGSYAKRYISASGFYGQMTRTTLTQFPAPVPPAFKNPVGVIHALNSIALLNSAFSKGGRRVR